MGVGGTRAREGIASEVRVVPARAGAVGLALRRTLVDGGEFGYHLGVLDGDGPPVLVDLAPPCGCDACDNGSAVLLGELDDALLVVLQGGMVHARRGVRRWQGEPWVAG